MAFLFAAIPEIVEGIVGAAESFEAFIGVARAGEVGGALAEAVGFDEFGIGVGEGVGKGLALDALCVSEEIQTILEGVEWAKVIKEGMSVEEVTCQIMAKLPAKMGRHWLQGKLADDIKEKIETVVKQHMPKKRHH